MPRNDSPGGRGAPTPVHATLAEILERPAVRPLVEPVPPPPPLAPELSAPRESADRADQPETGTSGAPLPEAASPPEIELKLVTDGGRLALFRDAPVIVANARNRGVRRHLRSVYYDTADRRLRKAGLSLRVRQSGSRFIQTVKTDYGRDTLRRGEWEAAVPTAAPDLALALPFLPE